MNDILELTTAQQIIDQLTQASIPLPPNHIIQYNKMTPYQTEGDKDKKCWYKLSVKPNERYATLSYGCHKRGIKDTVKIDFGNHQSLIPINTSHQKNDSSQYKANQVKKYYQQALTESLRHKNYNQYIAEHPYLIEANEKLTQHHIKLDIPNNLYRLNCNVGRKKQACLVTFLFPFATYWQDLDSNQPQAIERIYRDDQGKIQKRALGTKKQAVAIFGNFENTKTVYITEGIKDSLVAHQLTGKASICVYGKNNYSNIAKIAKEVYPNKTFIIIADSDDTEKAKQASKQYGIGCIVPPFTDKELTAGHKDLFDYLVVRGKKETKKWLESVPEKKNMDETIKKMIQEISNLSDMEYELTRKDLARKYRIRADRLDQFREKEITNNKIDNTNQDSIQMEKLEPWPDVVDGLQLANEIRSLFDKHVILDDCYKTALTLFVFLTYSFDFFSILPRILIKSPESLCGKSTLLVILDGLVYRSIMASNFTGASIFRSIQHWKPTLIIDEADSFMDENESLRNVINSGHMKRTAFVVRCTDKNDNHEPKLFSTWCPMVIAGIDQRSATIENRSIIVSIKRKLPDERIEKTSNKYFQDCIIIRRKIKRFIDDNLEKIKYNEKKIDIPNNLHNRTSDNWLPLLVIAKTIDITWEKRCLNAINFIELNQKVKSCDDSLELIKSIKQVFEIKKVDSISSENLIREIVFIEDCEDCRYFSTYNRNQDPIDSKQVKKILATYEIEPKRIYIEGKQVRGYKKEWFIEIWKRYLD